MDEQTKTFKRIERLIEVTSGILIISGLLIINLPIIPEPNKTVIYLASFFVFVFGFIWHKLKLPLSPLNKNFLESVVYIATIAVIVHVTGGVRSYFNFLYFLPNLNISIISTRRHTFIFWFMTAFFIFAETLIFPQPNINPVGGFPTPPLSLAVLNSWAVGLVAMYGNYLAKGVETAQIAATQAVVEKEKTVNSLKDEFLFIIAHELRGPITAIRGYLELFLNSKSSKSNNELTNLGLRAFRQSERLNDLIGELLDLSRLEVGKLKLSIESFDINTHLKEVLTSEIEQAKEKKIEYLFKPTEDILLVKADKERVREVTLIFSDNAIKYTGEFGKIWVWIERKNNKVFISIADSGVGIPADEIPYVFTRFHKIPSDDGIAEPTVEKKEKSIGLGLFLAKSLITRMGGEVFVESQVGKGSKFTFTLPASHV